MGMGLALPLGDDRSLSPAQYSSESFTRPFAGLSRGALQLQESGVKPFVLLLMAIAVGACSAGDREVPEDQESTSEPVIEVPVLDPESYTSIRGDTNVIRLVSPQPGEVISAPLTLRGEARGNWFFEASFPVTLTDWNGLIIAEGIATARGDWMTTEYVPFEAVLEYERPNDIGDFSRRGSLILQKDNPSGLPENSDALEITIFFWEGR